MNLALSGHKMAAKLVLLLAAGGISETFGLTKCCPRGQLLDLHTKDCIDHKHDTPGDISIKVTKFDKSRRQLVVRELPYNVPAGPFHDCERQMKRNIKDFVLVSTQGTNETLITDDGDQVETEFCVDNVYDKFGQIGSDKVVAQVCDVCNTSCISFCCAKGFYSYSGLCQEGNVSIPPLWPEIPYTRVVTQLVCNYTTYTQDHVTINNGGVQVDGVLKDHSQYCIDHRLRGLEDNVTTAEVMICSQPETEPVNVKQAVFITLWILSDISIFIIFLFHLFMLNKKTKRIFILKTIFLFCIFTTFLLLIIFYSINFDKIIFEHFKSLLCCYTVAFLIHYFSTASYFWLGVIAIDLFQCFKVIKSPGQNHKNIGISSYLCVTFISPALVSLVIVILQQIADEEKVFSHPRNDDVPCRLSHYHVQFLFINSIIGLLLCLILVTLLQLRFIYSHSIYSANPSSLERHKMDYWDMVDLFLVTVLAWSGQVASFILGWLHSPVWALDCISAGSGVLMLVAFILRRNNRKLIRQNCASSSQRQDKRDKQVCKVGKYQQINISTIKPQEEKKPPTVGQYRQMTIFDVF